MEIYLAPTMFTMPPLQLNNFKSVKLPFSFKNSVLAMGSEIKSSFAVLVENTVYMSGLFEDLRDPSIFEDFKDKISDARGEIAFRRGFPNVIACDLHPEYISTRYAREFFEEIGKRKKSSLFEIQHHHAHIASCMAENGLRSKVIGVAFDGTGYGSDGNIWGGEFLIADYRNFERPGHFTYVPMPGSEMAITEPIRMAFSYLYMTYGKSLGRLKLEVLKRLGRDRYSLFARMMDKGVNSPLTSSAGRLFDALSSLLGIRDRISYEGEAAIELERLAERGCKSKYTFEVKKNQGELVVEFWPMIREIVRDLRNRKDTALISCKFHNTMAEAIKGVCIFLRKKTKLNNVVLSGGVFQNRILLRESMKRLEDAHFSVFTHLKTSCADKGLSLGQAVIAAMKSRE